MSKEKDIRDDEIRVIGSDDGQRKKSQGWKWLVLLVAGIVIGIIVWQALPVKQEPIVEDIAEPGYFDHDSNIQEQPIQKTPLSHAEETGHGFVEIADTTINDIPLQIYIPHQMSFSLYVGAVDRNDPSILYAAQAADVRADNGGIVGAFVLKGEPLAWGLSKKGYCAIINDTVTIGVADNSPLFEEATEKQGYFFRQFPLVDNGQLVENELKGKSIRRAICDRGGEILIVETLTTESFHDFAQALVDLGIDNAIYMVGSNSYGWATDADGVRHPFGNPDPPKKKWKNISYLLMKEKP
ncbi:MAG: hypothetical protein II887_05570 [Bacteroidales bacterium]|nr:hypothetical protein [Bacteroidales bacterium]